MERAQFKLGARAKYEMREKVEGVRAESKIRGKAERKRVSTKTKANKEALDIAKGRAEAKEK